ncbi:MAG: endonuclease III [candidate division Zixibacteria bacterium]|nr:endonuclease III [candidate division Zixibacteria bacterium]
MARESLDAKRARAVRIIRELRRLYPKPRTVLTYRSKFELLIAVILSAQATDSSVNAVTPRLFGRFPTQGSLASADLSELSAILKPVGLANSKAKAIKETARMIRDQFGGEVPSTVEDLMLLRGVGRKTALVVLGEGFGIAEGIAVDTHVNRVSQRLGFTRYQDPVRVERDLVGIIQRKDWIATNHLLIFHGRATCKARVPLCSTCIVNTLCPSAKE